MPELDNLSIRCLQTDTPGAGHPYPISGAASFVRKLRFCSRDGQLDVHLVSTRSIRVLGTHTYASALPSRDISRPRESAVESEHNSTTQCSAVFSGGTDARVCTLAARA